MIRRMAGGSYGRLLVCAIRRCVCVDRGTPMSSPRGRGVGCLLMVTLFFSKFVSPPDHYFDHRRNRIRCAISWVSAYPRLRKWCCASASSAALHPGAPASHRARLLAPIAGFDADGLVQWPSSAERAAPRGLDVVLRFTVALRGAAANRRTVARPIEIPRSTEMKKSDLVTRVATQASLSRPVADATVNAVLAEGLGAPAPTIGETHKCADKVTTPSSVLLGYELKAWPR